MITGRPTSYNVVSGTSSGFGTGNYNDNNLTTYASIASSAGTHGIVNFITFPTGTPQTTTNTFTFHFYTKCTIGVGDTYNGSVTFSYTPDGGTNWYTLGTIATDDTAATDHSYSVTYPASGSGNWLGTNTNLKVRADCLGGFTIGPVWSTTTCRCYEIYITYQGYYTAVTDTSAVTTTATSVYSSARFNTSTGVEDAYTAASAINFTGTISATPVSCYRLTGSTETA